MPSRQEAARDPSPPRWSAARPPPSPDDVPDQVREALTPEVLDDILLSLRGVSVDDPDLLPPEPSDEVLSELISPPPAPVVPEPRAERQPKRLVSALSLVLAGASLLFAMLAFAATVVSLSILFWS